MRMQALCAAVLVVAAGASPALAAVSPAGADSGDVTCPPGFLGVLKVARNLIVPARSSCGLDQGSVIGHDVIVRPGASFFIGGTKIGHDLLATRADLIELGDVNNGSSDTVIGHDAIITGTVGTVPFGEFICQTRIGHDLVIRHTASTASGLDIGAPEPANCGRNRVSGPRFADTIGHDGIFADNAGAYLDVGWNRARYNGKTGRGFGHDLIFVNNHEGHNILARNTIGHNCLQRDNHRYRGSRIQAGHRVDGCNTTKSSGEVWGKAEEVPGLAALSAGGGAGVSLVSCARTGDCSAGGTYTGRSGQQGFVVGETRGVWGKAQEIPGLAALNTLEGAIVSSVSCARPGDCSAGGSYAFDRGSEQGFVVGETMGLWGRAQEVPGLAALSPFGPAFVDSVSCGEPGDCSAGGAYTFSSGGGTGFVAVETRGVWGKAEEVPGLAALNTAGQAFVISVSCSRPGDCSAGGDYENRLTGVPPFVVSETRGVWGKAEKVRGLPGNGAVVSSVSCARPGDCGAGGYLFTRSGGQQGFVVDQTRGVWGKAEEVPGLAALNTLGFAQVNSVSCTRPGDCSAGGDYENRPGGQGFVVTETGGVWGKAQRVAGLNLGGVTVSSLSCSRPGECSAGGGGFTSSFQKLGFVVAETRGVWGKAEQVPGLAALGAGVDSAVLSVSCAPAGDCSAVGEYGQKGFVVSQK